MPLSNKGVMIILSSPSGAGKTTLVKMLSKIDNFEVSISHTTRSPRMNETQGKDYFFVDVNEFQRLIKNQEFLEYAKVFGNYYGTPAQLVERTLKSGVDVLFDIDWQGTQQLKARARLDLVSVFILPPSIKELEKRLFKRAQDTSEVVANRMSKSASEMSHYPEYDYVIINHDLDKSVQQVQSILCAERSRRERQIGLVEFVKYLRAQL